MAFLVNAGNGFMVSPQGRETGSAGSMGLRIGAVYQNMEAPQIGSGDACQYFIITWRIQEWRSPSNDTLAPSFGRGRRAKRGGVGCSEWESTVFRCQPPPLRGTSFQRKEGESE